MPTEKNIQAVAELAEDFKSSSLVITAEYRGLNVNEMQGMRRAVRESEAQFKIAKNTLARIAADDAGRPELKELIDGPIGFLTTQGDPAAAAKVLVNYIDDNSVEMTITGGALDTEMLTVDRIKALAKLPSKEVLLAKMMGSMNSPITGLVMVMSGPVRALATVLQRISEQGGAAAAEAASEDEPEAASDETPAAEADAADKSAEANTPADAEAETPAVEAESGDAPEAEAEADAEAPAEEAAEGEPPAEEESADGEEEEKSE